ncbi:hypothetical protein TU94_03310 [Streptomyces cyaneogriseus subsp. noncyanogenus]|uniref:Uncharacterized protein n=1 Tax=Streptomyces cyaneogriseus subsp. noncyanogenus TaxID=477245 RepID=A0A0C5FXU0_9ACTN|nr:hypothetical protein TU94_03310 [Streptomyces cyaneogriseus subsp. noncyanogenus]
MTGRRREHAGHGTAGGGTGGGPSADVGLDAVLAAARAKSLSDPVEIVPPADSSCAYVVRQVRPARSSWRRSPCPASR